MAGNIDRHISEEHIEAYSMGTLNEEESAPFEEHLLICETCRNQVLETDAYLAAMYGASTRVRQPAKPAVRFQFFSRLLPLLSAAALVLALAVAGLWLGRVVPVIPANVVNLTSTRGVGIDVKAPPGRALNLNLDLEGLPAAASFRVDIVDRGGTIVWNGTAQSRDSKAIAQVAGLAAGIYFVRLYTTSGELVREYGLEIAS